MGPNAMSRVRGATAAGERARGGVDGGAKRGVRGTSDRGETRPGANAGGSLRVAARPDGVPTTAVAVSRLARLGRCLGGACARVARVGMRLVTPIAAMFGVADAVPTPRAAAVPRKGADECDRTAVPRTRRPAAMPITAETTRGRTRARMDPGRFDGSRPRGGDGLDDRGLDAAGEAIRSAAAMWIGRARRGRRGDEAEA